MIEFKSNEDSYLNRNFVADKKESYRLMQEQLKALLENERNLIPNLANASALLNLSLTDINWVGFYQMEGGELLLGPFQGKPACIHISIGKGVCGTAALEGKTQVVPDVHAFPGHIACDSASRSEIVVPIIANGKVVAVLDIDSPIPGHFDTEDQAGLEPIAHILAEGCDWGSL